MQGHDGHDEVLTAWALVEARGAHRVGLGDRAVRVVQNVRTGVGAEPVVGAGQSEGLLDHRRTTGHARRRVVFRVGDERCAHAEHQLWVDLTVGVLVAVLKVHLKGGGPPLAVGQADLGLEHGAAGVDLSHVGPVDVLAGHGATGVLAAFWDLLGEKEGAGGDEEVFLFFSVHPLNDALGEQVAEGGFAAAELLEMTWGQARRTVVEDEQGAQDAALVGVDEDVTVLGVVADGDLRRDQAATAGVLELVDQVHPVVVDAVDVTVHVDAVTVGPVVGLVNVHVVELPADHGVINLLGDVDHLSGVLDQTTVLTLRGLVGAQTTPLGGVQVTCLEVRLAADQRAGHAAHVRKRGKEGGAVQKLAHTAASTDPIPGGQRVHDLGGQHVGAEAGTDAEFALAVVVALELVLEVASELSSGHAEKVLDQVASEANALVGVVVLVVGCLVGQRHFEHLTDDAAHEDGLLLAVGGGVAEVRQELTVEELVDALLTVLTLLAGGELLLKPLVGFLGVHRVVLFVVVDFVDVGHDVLEGLSGAGDGGENLLIVVDAKGTHQQDHGDGGRAGRADLHHEHAVTTLFDGEGLAHTVLLGEDLGDLGLLRIALVDLHGHAVGREVFHRNEHTLGAVDDEVTTGVEGVLALGAQQAVPCVHVVMGRGRGQHAVTGDVVGVQVAALGAHHDRHVADLDRLLGVPRNAVAVNGEVNGDRGEVGQLAKTALHRGRGVFGPVGFLGHGFAELDVLEANDDVLVGDVKADEPALFVLDFLVGADADVADDGLHARWKVFPGGNAIVIGCDLMVHETALAEVGFDNLLHDAPSGSAPLHNEAIGDGDASRGRLPNHLEDTVGDPTRSQRLVVGVGGECSHVLGFSGFFDDLDHGVRDEDLREQFLGEALLTGFGVLADEVPRFEFFGFHRELLFAGNVWRTKQFLVRHHRVVQRVEADVDLWTVIVVDGFGANGEFAALLLRTAAGALVGDDPHDVGVNVAFLGDAEAGRDLVGTHLLDVRHVAVGGQFVGRLFLDTKFNEALLRCAFHDQIIPAFGP